MALILLDAGVVGLLIANPSNRKIPAAPEAEDAQAWYDATADNIHTFVIADVTRYEVLRGLLHRAAPVKLRRLDNLLAETFAVAIDLPTWNRAAQIWADARQRGLPTAHDLALDGDAILAAVAAILAEAGDPVIVATTNVRHLATLGTDARDWRAIAN